MLALFGLEILGRLLLASDNACIDDLLDKWRVILHALIRRVSVDRGSSRDTVRSGALLLCDFLSLVGTARLWKPHENKTQGKVLLVN